jgi:hypothetical protein
VKNKLILACLVISQVTSAAGSRRLSILAQRASAQIQSNLSGLTAAQDEALLKRYEEIFSILEGNIPRDPNSGSGAIFYCDGGYINDFNGNDLDYISGGDEGCRAAIRGQFYCDGGYVNNSTGADLDYISGGQSACIEAIRGSFYCDRGYIHNNKGEELDYISGGQSACIAAIRGSFYCDGGYINNERGEDLDYISGGQEACLRSLE